MARMIRLMIPDIEPQDVEAVAAVLRDGQLVQGRRVQEFEAAIADRAGVRHVIAVSSGTAALHLAIQALGIGTGDAVAVPAYTWPATANVVVLAGAEPVFVDIEARTFGMDSEALERVLARDRRIKAVMPVHAFGQGADMGALAAICEARGVTVLEDAACALGASVGGRPAGSWGAAGCFSFHPRKVITTGEGGAVATNDSDIASRIRILRNHGLDPRAPSPSFVAAGYNLRLTEFQAALGSGQLRRLDHILAQRRAVADAYAACFAGSDIECPRPEDPASHTYQSYVVLLPRRLNHARPAIIEELRTHGIEATIGTHHVPLTGYYAGRYGFGSGDFPVTDDIAGRALTLPLHHALDSDAIHHVAGALLVAVA